MMMRRFIVKTKDLYLGGLLIVSLVLIVQVEATAQSGNNLAPYLQQFEEKIILQTDRGTYVSGETVWFTSHYLINGQRPSEQISKILYVELINHKSEPVIQKKFNIEDHRSNGRLELPVEIPSGNYVLRAYTKYQRNLSPFGFAYKHLYILNPDTPPERSDETIASDINIYFDGKNKSGNKHSHYIMHVKNPSLVDSLHLLNKADSVLFLTNNIKSQYQRMSFVADSTATLRLVIYLENGETLEQQVPPEASNYIVRRPGDEFLFSLQGKSGIPADNLMWELYNTSFRNVFSRKFNESQNSIDISGQDLTDGLHCLALRNLKTNKILAYQSFYVFPDIDQKQMATTEKKTFAKREKVEVSLATDGSDLAQQISVSVVRKGTGSNNEKIHRDFALTNPWFLNSFLSNQKNLRSYRDEIEAALRVYDVKYAETIKRELNPDKPVLEYLPEIKDITISGILKDKTTGQTMPGYQIYGSVLFNNPQFHISETDTNGAFIFHLNELHGIQDVFLCPLQRDSSSQNLEILINRDFDNRHLDISNTAFPFTDKDKALLEELYMNYQLSLAFNEQISSPKKGNENRRFYYLFGKERISRVLDDYVSLDDMWDVLYEVIPHVKPVKRKGSYKLKIMNDDSWVLPGNPLILLDNVPVFDVAKIMEIHPSQVEKIEVIDQTYLLGAYAINGVVLITTKTDSFAGVAFPEASVFAEYLTAEMPAHFKSKSYASDTSKDTRIPDFRNLLYWDNYLKDNSHTLTFYTSDREGTYEIIIKGINDEGKNLLQIEKIEVKE